MELQSRNAATSGRNYELEIVQVSFNSISHLCFSLYHWKNFISFIHRREYGSLLFVISRD